MLNTFKEKLHVVKSVKRCSLPKFPSLEEVTDKNESLIPNVQVEIIIYLEILAKSFDWNFGVGELET